MTAAFADTNEFTTALGHSRGIAVTDVVVDANGTIYPITPSIDPSIDPSIETIETTEHSSSASLELAPEIAVMGELSRGGMGRILVAEQVSIGREVAVKVAVSSYAQGTLRTPGSPSSTIARTDIVIEARVAGQLEHPNIVPVHILGLADGQPAIVMKRIEGETWKSLMKSSRDLGRDVAILVDVCRALHFAHTRGVVHRDVKPQNVMVGSFGEVYLLDWGIAVGFGPYTISELPHARDIKTIAGTPSYMAPEMAFPDGTIDQRTDVYLAGAVLFEIATGRPPRSRVRIDDALFEAHTAAPIVLPADTPDELAAIIHKAMARDQAERFQSADELRLALVHFQNHAAAREVCAAAEERLAELRGLIAAAPASDEVDDGAHEARLQRVFNECRFGFALALRTWPGSARAQAGNDRTLVAMAAHDVARGQLDGARALIADLANPPRELVDAVERATAALAEKRAAEQASVAKLEHIAHESDVNFAGRERAVITVLCGSGWFAMMFAMDLLARYDIYRAGSGTFGALVASLALVLGVAGVVMPRIRATAVSRSLHTSLVVGVAGIALLHAIGWSFGVPPAPMLALGHLVLSVSLLTVAAHDHRIVLGAALSVLIPIGIALLPGELYLVAAFGSLVALAAVAWGWGRPREPTTSTRRA